MIEQPPSREPHWQGVYQSKRATELSWYQAHLELSITLLRLAGLSSTSRIIDVGGGTSTLVDDLLDQGVADITVLDISAAALQLARQRLGERATKVHWLAVDVREAIFPEARFDLWHDRAALHFLTDPSDAAAYVGLASRAIAPGGHAIIACFAADGPERCSQLPIVRREPGELAALFGPTFALIDSRRERHRTPSDNVQSFVYTLLHKQR